MEGIEQSVLNDTRRDPLRVPLIAGGVAGTLTDITLFPLDTLKTRLQAGGSGGIVIRGLYQGLGPAALASAPSAAALEQVSRLPARSRDRISHSGSWPRAQTETSAIATARRRWTIAMATGWEASKAHSSVWGRKSAKMVARRALICRRSALNIGEHPARTMIPHIRCTLWASDQKNP